MNERVKELFEQAGFPKFDIKNEAERFAELIVSECVNTLEFHGFDEAVPYIKWMVTNKLGVK